MNSARHTRATTAILVTLLMLTGVSAPCQQADESVLVSEPANTDQYLAGSLVRVSAPVEGDITAAGREVVLEARVSGDAIVAGERIEISGDVLDDVRAAGRLIDISGGVNGHVVAAGAEITLTKSSSVNDWVWLAGQRIDLRGNIGGELRAVGESVVITGSVAGNADILAENFRLEPGASIQGDLIWRGTSEPDISSDARLGGELVRKPIPRDDEDGISILATLFVVVSLTLLALVIGLLFPDAGTQLGKIVRKRPWMTLGVAVIVLILTPPLIAVCFATGVGIVIGVLLLTLFIALLTAGVALGMLAIAHAGAAKFNKPVATRGELFRAVLLVALVIWVASWLPLLGGLVLLLTWLIGIGAVEIAGYRRLYPQ